MNHSVEQKFTDQQLVERALGGYQPAAAQIVRQTEGLVAQIVFKMIPLADDRKDIVQDVYLKAFRHLAGFRFNAKLSTWIGRITYNTCLHYLEKKRLVFLPERPADGDQEDDGLDLLMQSQQPLHQNPIEQQLSGRERTAILGNAIRKLSPPVYQTLITLYHQEELSYAEIAEITSLPEGTVKNYLFRARNQLKKNLLSIYNREAL
ncbi:sigma-70 family RNA polymerase sigma factor [Chitinophaga sp. Mgbs1]|uniref:Sigma-70 family RNA polymerase sigma factor n=1 Tax=Chitinophaga solisilvae TaxID=1233460 RepID=A0A433WPV3_9BACT|nr:sigma-70 family RNA polymerase sigma factor [Chitinophaga solisilvae]